MLPKLTRIADERKIVFLLATNHIEDFDFAISRPGRFDMLLPVMPPTLSEKFSRKQWKGMKTRLRPLLLVKPPKHDVLTYADILNALTFDEFDAFYESTKNTRGVVSLKKKIDKAWAKATLNKPHEIPQDRSGETETLLGFYRRQCHEIARVRVQKSA
jgi:hypothetical protein